MSMKMLVCILLFGCLQLAGFSQKVSLIKIDALNKRLLNGKDTTFVVNFWATWCIPCVKELPYFEQLSRQYKSKKLTVLLVSVDFKSKLNTAVIPFIKKRKITTEVFLLDEQNQQEYINSVDTGWSGALPATLFLNSTVRKFVEKEFTYSALVNQYRTLQQ